MPCTCGNPGTFDSCCGPYLAGKPVPTAEALMRARYCAYVHGKIDFIHDSQTGAARAEFDRDGALQWSRQSKWLGLEVKQCTAGGPKDESGTVEFIARFELGGEVHEHHEIATFTREDGRWCFADGKPPKQEPFRRNAPKVGPNEPCVCGSGKKFKKCCAKK